MDAKDAKDLDALTEAYKAIVRAGVRLVEKDCSPIGLTPSRSLRQAVRETRRIEARIVKRRPSGATAGNIGQAAIRAAAEQRAKPKRRAKR
jgi:hypothetical protein